MRTGLRVLVPRGGAWGSRAAALLEQRGAVPVIVPLIAYEPGEAMPPELARGDVDWLVVTSARTVEVLGPVAASTRIIAVGEATAAALRAAGLDVSFVPRDHAAAGVVDEWPGAATETRVLLPQSNLADPGLASALQGRGLAVRTVVAYRTVAVPVIEPVEAVDAILVTSGSVARQVAAQLAPLPPGTRVACIGERTAAEARACGLAVHVVAAERSLESLVAAL